MTDVKKALITGISGQDGSYLAELLLEKGYEVHGLVQRMEMDNPGRSLWRIQPILGRLKLHKASIERARGLFRIIERVQPDECYHLAASSFSQYTFDEEFAVFNTNANGTHYVLSALKECAPSCRFFFAASSEIFGRAEHSPQNERTPIQPRSIYGITKVTGYQLTRHYRDNYHMFACAGILYNHESERRGVEFVTRKITSGAARIKAGLAGELRLGNLDSRRDWGYAPDYVRAMWMMLQQDQADDYVIATGNAHSVREFVQAAFSAVGLDWERYVVVDPAFYRPAEQVVLAGDASKARDRLGWQPAVSFADMVQRMVRVDLKREGIG